MLNDRDLWKWINEKCNQTIDWFFFVGYYYDSESVFFLEKLINE